MSPAATPDRFLEREGVCLRYRVEGSGPAIVLIHGWLLDLEIWDRQVAGLAGEFRVLRMDRRGFGGSGGTPDLQADARDLLALLALLDIDRAAVLGMSQGARVAIELALTAPGRVACLILDGAPPLEGLAGRHWPPETPLEHYRRLLRERGIEALRSELATHPLMRLNTNDRTAHAALAASLRRYDGADLAGAPEPAGPPADRLGRLAMPVLVMNGDHDTDQRIEAGKALAGAIPRAERCLVAGAGHLACLDDPRSYNSIVRDFLRRSFSDTSIQTPREQP